MRALLIALALALAGCVAYEPPVAVAQPPAPAKSRYVQELERFRAEVAQRRSAAPDEDKTARAVLTCSQLFSRGSDGERLCLMRGMDRYVDHLTPPISERYVQPGEISLTVPRAVEQPPVAAPPPPPVPAQPGCWPPCTVYVPVPVQPGIPYTP